jgi:hypothetical protein
MKELGVRELKQSLSRLIATGVAMTLAHEPGLWPQQLVGLAIGRHEPVGMPFGNVR